MKTRNIVILFIGIYIFFASLNHYNSIYIVENCGPGKKVIKSENHDSTCIFILSSPGSGSSTMTKVLSQCMGEKETHKCIISGENWGAIQALSVFASKMLKTDQQSRRNEHDEVAWHKVYNDFKQVHAKELDLVSSIFNPYGSSCWGFKEVRYGREVESIDNFENEVNYLTTLCNNPKIIFHTRANITQELNSTIMRKIMRKRRGERIKTIRQHECFDTYSAQAPISSKCQGPPKIPVFRHYLEDFLERNDNFVTLWEDYLGCTAPIPEEDVKLSSLTQKM